MGRPYLPNTHGIGRAFGYPGGAVPEALECIGFQPPNPPSPNPFWNPVGLVLYFAELIPPPIPGEGPLIRWARRWDAEEVWCFLPPPISEPAPTTGGVEYFIQFAPITDPGPTGFPNGSAIRHFVQIYWDFPSFGWSYEKFDSTLTGQINRVGWNMPLYGQGFASPPCSISRWAIGFNGMDWGPAPWSSVSEQMEYDPLDVWVPDPF